MSRIVVTGGRDYRDYERVRETLAALAPTEIAHGGARGADSLAHFAAIELHIPVTVFPADWETHGKAAGILRNIAMLRTFQPDLVVAFPGGRGTAHCVREAQKRGIAVQEVA